MAVHQIPTPKPSNTRRYLRRIGTDHVIACRRDAQSNDQLAPLTRKQRRALRARNHRALVASATIAVTGATPVRRLYKSSTYIAGWSLVPTGTTRPVISGPYIVDVNEVKLV